MTSTHREDLRPMAILPALPLDAPTVTDCRTEGDRRADRDYAIALAHEEMVTLSVAELAMLLSAAMLTGLHGEREYEIVSSKHREDEALEVIRSMVIRKHPGAEDLARAMESFKDCNHAPEAWLDYARELALASRAGRCRTR